MKYKNIILEKEGNISKITLNRPEKLNALNFDLMYELRGALDEIEVDKDNRVLIITGSGRAFCAGADIDTFSTKPEAILYHSYEYQSEMIKLTNFEKPVIAAVNGIASGGGAEHALMCDIIVASERASFVFPGAHLGAVCPYGIIRLASEVGRAKAKELMLTGDRINAEEALTIGLINKVVPHSQLLDTAFEMAKKIAKAAPISVKITKEAVNYGMNRYNYSQKVFYQSMKTEDFEEGLKSFLEKREPNFKGK